ncbi:hypothetical protein BKA67DRAFT_540972 [Truncatella angustata]|uniref:Myb-like DNA-binding domain-containing protein n=1 Tax=Truncatella angustata TaxID=152316 RepID=A0A9P8RH86_9PEZI|nr:uncharacterized protein BKA67DRAFT_540972 [Truncatella angustata]KAH6645978.1 hypothetical protein BKA67DRAFT_540972 [Truncatella angustata]KAH8205495.1 hypothetical protein TruAng_000401 [Truncatella angustata]
MSNNDNVMARFLFAILQQKNLKDIDWNKVACNPLLAQEITNGHAARMRYSRFRSAMLNLEPQRRNRTTKEKANRVTKSKKEPKDSKSKKEDVVKTESVAGSASVAESTEAPSPSPRIKQERVPPTYNSRLTPASMSTTPAAATHPVVQPRLLTPCSDTDTYPTSPTMMSSPATEMLTSQSPYEFPLSHFGHDQLWSHHSMFPPFEPPYAFDPMQMTFDHQGMHHHGECTSAPGVGDAEGEEVSIKQEHWDNRFV